MDGKNLFFTLNRKMEEKSSRKIKSENKNLFRKLCLCSLPFAVSPVQCSASPFSLSSFLCCFAASHTEDRNSVSLAHAALHNFSAKFRVLVFLVELLLLSWLVFLFLTIFFSPSFSRLHCQGNTPIYFGQRQFYL